MSLYSQARPSLNARMIKILWRQQQELLKKSKIIPKKYVRRILLEITIICYYLGEEIKMKDFLSLLNRSSGSLVIIRLSTESILLIMLIRSSSVFPWA